MQSVSGDLRGGFSTYNEKIGQQKIREDDSICPGHIFASARRSFRGKIWSHPPHGGESRRASHDRNAYLHAVRTLRRMCSLHSVGGRRGSYMLRQRQKIENDMVGPWMTLRSRLHQQPPAQICQMREVRVIGMEWTW